MACPWHTKGPAAGRGLDALGELGVRAGLQSGIAAAVHVVVGCGVAPEPDTVLPAARALRWYEY